MQQMTTFALFHSRFCLASDCNRKIKTMILIVLKRRAVHWHYYFLFNFCFQTLTNNLIIIQFRCFVSLQILSGLYIGNFRDSKDMKQLDIHKITHILSIHDDARKLFKAISASSTPSWMHFLLLSSIL